MEQYFQLISHIGLNDCFVGTFYSSSFLKPLEIRMDGKSIVEYVVCNSCNIRTKCLERRPISHQSAVT